MAVANTTLPANMARLLQEVASSWVHKIGTGCPPLMVRPCRVQEGGGEEVE